MESRFNPGELICTVYVYRDRNATRTMIREPCALKSTDEPAMTQRDREIIWDKGLTSGQLVKWKLDVRWAQENGTPAPDEPTPNLQKLMAESAYLRWHYRTYGGMPWD